MQKYFDSIKKELSGEFARNAVQYLRVGLNLFHHIRRQQNPASIETSIGNIASAIELMLKSFLCSKNPYLAFKDLPNELKLLFAPKIFRRALTEEFMILT